MSHLVLYVNYMTYKVKKCKIEEYCKKTGNEFLFNQWINYHKISNPSKLLLLFFFREKTNDYNPNESEIEFIHKSFYEYLSALEILNTIMEISTLNKVELCKRIFYLLSKSLLGVETIEFIEGLLEYDPRFSFEKYIDVISSIVPRVFNINWPIEISKEKSDNRIYIKDYQDLLKSIRNTEENIMRLLEIVELGHCELSNSTYNKTLLNSCSMDNSNLKECDFTSAHMEAASMSNSDLSMSIFDSAVLDGAYLCDSLLQDTSFCGAKLVGCNLDEAKLINTDFADADLERADLDGAIIKKVNWQNCSLKDAKLQNVKISQFDLSSDEIIEMLAEADLSDANWKDVPEEIKNMILNEKCES